MSYAADHAAAVAAADGGRAQHATGRAGTLRTAKPRPKAQPQHLAPAHAETRQLRRAANPQAPARSRRAVPPEGAIMASHRAPTLSVLQLDRW